MPGRADRKPSTTAAQRRRDGHDAQEPQDAQRPQHRQPLPRRHQRHGDDDKIEDVPAGAEKGPAPRHDLGGKLDHEDGKAQQIQRKDQSPRRRHCLIRGFKPKDHRVEQDHPKDRVTHKRGLKLGIKAGTKGHGSSCCCAAYVAWPLRRRKAEHAPAS